jgi:hypothetical protein
MGPVSRAGAAYRWQTKLGDGRPKTTIERRDVIMTWNYRVMARAGRYAVYAVYYDDDGRIKYWSAEPMELSGETVEGLNEELERYRRALSEPVLDYDAPEPRSTQTGEGVVSTAQVSGHAPQVG